jgi:polyphosphate kinase
MPLEKFFNRDLSLLAFNRRVLAQATDPSYPLLERVRFVSIFSSNMDEFFMKRIGYLKRLQAKGSARAGADGAAPAEVLARVRAETASLFAERARAWEQELKPALAAAGIELAGWDALTPAERERASAYFQAEVFPVLTPLAVDPAHPFPFLSNLSVSLGVRLRNPAHPDTLFARLKIPDVLPQWVRVSEGEGPLRLCRLQDLIQAHLSSFFPDMLLHDTTAFRVLRSADTEQVIDDADDLLDVVEEGLRLRRTAEIVAIQHSDGSDPWFQRMLGEYLDLDPEDLFPSPGELNYLALSELAGLPYPQHRFTPWQPLVPAALAGEDGDIFRVLRDHDELLHLPFESFQASVERLIRAAARDEQVLAIKIALYRLGEDSPLVPLLIEAAERGKQVVCVVELKARFDEARNIYWSEQLEKAGVHVVYGVVGLKTHAKIALVVRRENDGYRFYGHVGTGNYNPATARLYTDFGLFTSRREVTQEMIEIFNYLTGLSLNRRYEHFLLAPVNMRQRFSDLIDREIAHAAAGRPARIAAKMNSLEDAAIIDKLYQASQAGVPVDLVVRGFCCLIPGVPGLSDKIRVKSVVGRFLEHSRVYAFANGQADLAAGEFFIGSADWMSRNLSNRVETIVPILAPGPRQELADLLKLYLDDSVSSWVLQSDGGYAKGPSDGRPPVQEQLMARARERHRAPGA